MRCCECDNKAYRQVYYQSTGYVWECFYHYTMIRMVDIAAALFAIFVLLPFALIDKALKKLESLK